MNSQTSTQLNNRKVSSKINTQMDKVRELHYNTRNEVESELSTKVDKTRELQDYTRMQE